MMLPAQQFVPALPGRPFCLAGSRPRRRRRAATEIGCLCVRVAGG